MAPDTHRRGGRVRCALGGVQSRTRRCVALRHMSRSTAHRSPPVVPGDCSSGRREAAVGRLEPADLQGSSRSASFEGERRLRSKAADSRSRPQAGAGDRQHGDTEVGETRSARAFSVSSGSRSDASAMPRSSSTRDTPCGDGARLSRGSLLRCRWRLAARAPIRRGLRMSLGWATALSAERGRTMGTRRNSPAGAQEHGAQIVQRSRGAAA